MSLKRAPGKIQQTVSSCAGTHELLAVDITFFSYDPNPRFFIRTFDASGGSGAVPTDADLANQGGETPSGSYVRAGSATGFTIVSTNPNYQGPDSDAVPSNPTPYTDGQALPYFQVVGSPGLTTGGANATNPIVFAQAVIPAGQSVGFFGFMGAESGPPVPVGSGPEPADLGLLSFALVGLFRRRRSGRA